MRHRRPVQAEQAAQEEAGWSRALISRPHAKELTEELPAHTQGETASDQQTSRQQAASSQALRDAEAVKTADDNTAHETESEVNQASAELDDREPEGNIETLDDDQKPGRNHAMAVDRPPALGECR